MRAPRPSDLVRDVLAYLALAGIPAWRQNAGATRMPSGRWVQFGGGKGMPDVLGVLGPSKNGQYTAGRLLCVECKTGHGRLSADQRAALSALGAAGALALTVRDVAGLAAALAGAGYFVPRVAGRP